MTNMQAGWFTDPSDKNKQRWWDGTVWTDDVSRNGAVWREALPVPRVAPVPAARKFPVWAWIALGVAGLIAVLLIPSLLPAAPQNDALVGAVPLVSGEDAGESEQRSVPAQTSTPVPTRTPTPTPSPTPRTTTRDETVTQPIAFERVTVEDGTFARGTTQITTGGADGEKTLTYRVTLSDGKEVSRELVSEVVTREPVSEVTSLGI